MQSQCSKKKRGVPSPKKGDGMTISRNQRTRTGEIADGLCAVEEGGDRARGDSDARLVRVIEREIIPRLFLAHRAAGAGGDPGPDARLGDEGSTAFAEFVLLNDTAQIKTRLESLFDRGASRERVYLDLVAPAARHLRALGGQDRYDTDAVSRGLARLRLVLGEFGGDPIDNPETIGGFAIARPQRTQ